MTEQRARRYRPSLRGYLVTGGVACAALMAVAYAELLDYYLGRGIDLKTEYMLARTATAYANASAAGDEPPLPAGTDLRAFLDAETIPTPWRSVFDLDVIEHGEMQRRINRDFNEDGDLTPVDTLDLCPDGRCDLLFLMAHDLDASHRLFLVHGVVVTDEALAELDFTEQVAFAVGVLFTVLLLGVSVLLVRSINGPLRRLDRWSAALAHRTEANEIPELRFEEFDRLAQRLDAAFAQVHAGVEREKRFLGDASHELRTPIAVLAANVELLDRLTERADRSEAETAAIRRQYRALEDVRQLIEALLWVNRQSDSLPEPEPVELAVEVESVVRSHRTLADERGLAVVVEGVQPTLVLPLQGVRIVLSNLVRNAFQHATQGEVRITIGATFVRVANADAGRGGAGGPSGYGLGLDLVTRICARLEWRLELDDPDDGWVAEVHFEAR